jgi:hypothetical protein
MKREEVATRWAELEQLEEQAHGSFTGGFLLSVAPDALAPGPQIIQDTDPGVIDTILDSLEVPLLHAGRADSPEAMKQEMARYFKQSAELANLAAKGFEALSDEAARSIYEEFIELQERANGSGDAQNVGFSPRR